MGAGLRQKKAEGIVSSLLRRESLHWAIRVIPSQPMTIIVDPGASFVPVFIDVTRLGPGQTTNRRGFPEFEVIHRRSHR